MLRKRLGNEVQGRAISGQADKGVVAFSGVRTLFASEVVLDGIDFRIERGEFACLLGPSGCGKSTTLRIAGNLLTSYSGNVSVNGMPPSEAWRHLAYVFQSPRLVPWRTALGNVELGMQLRFGRLPRDECRRRARESLALVGLANDAEKYPAVLSGGERQRVSIARAIAVEPDIIMMDEPLSALDAQTKLRLRDEILRIWRETQKTVVYVTHDIDEALYLADKVIVFSSKPTKIISTTMIDRPRPRDVEKDVELRRRKAEIFERLGGAVAIA
jgi:NitT/TauT family transport system ATP-binding protein